MDSSSVQPVRLPAGARDIHSMPVIDHAGAKGTPPAPPEPPALTEEWQLVEIPAEHIGYVGYSSDNSGLRRRMHKNREQWQAYVSLADIPGQGDEILTVERYIVPDADPQKVDAYSVINPAALMREYEMQAAIARSHMAKGEASPRDMVGLLRDLLKEQERRSRAYHTEMARKAQQQKQDEEDIALAKRCLRGMQLLEALEGKK